MKVQILFVVALCMASSLFSQQTTLSHDQIPGVNPSYKPAFQEDYPEWAKMLYQEDANYYSIVEAYEQWKVKRTDDFRAVERYFKIWRKQVLPYVDADGSIRTTGIASYYRNLHEAQTSPKPANRNTGGPWTFLGPKETFWLNESGDSQAPEACPWQVNVYSFDVSKSNNSTLYCGTETGYVSKTTDEGDNWTLLGQDYVFGGGVTAVAIHPTDENTVYISAGRQLHKTTDGGASWTPLLPGNGQFFSDKIIIDETNPDKVLAAGSTGIYRSTDAGNTWTNVWNFRAYDIHFKPGDTEVVYGISKVGGFFRVVSSEDGGQTFDFDLDFPTGLVDASGALLAVTPAAADNLYAILLSSNDTPLLYLGDMSTGNWSLLATGQTDELPMNNWQGFFDLVLEVSPTNPNIIFTGTASLFRSTNGGTNFSLVGGYGGNFPVHPDIQCMKLLDNNIAWVSTDGGFTRSADNFTLTSFAEAKNNNLIGSDMWGFDQGWNEDLIVGGRYHNGNTAIADFYQPKAIRMGGAESPTGWVLKGKRRHVAFNDLGAGWILPETAEGQPQGRFIFSKFPNMDEYGGRRGNVLIHPNYYEMVYLGEGNGFWISNDMGASFELLHDFGSRIRFVQMGYNDPNIIYADIVNQGLFRSEDGGYTWEAKPSLTNGSNGTGYWAGRMHFELSPYDANVIYACLQNGTWSADIGKVFKSTDGGDTWEDWTGTLDVFTKSLVCQPDGAGNDILYLFTSNRNGQAGQCYIRRSGEADWSAYGDDYPVGMSPNHVLPFFRDSKIRVSGNSGVWENRLDEPDFQPIIQPWIGRPFYDCMLDTIQFEDHSILNHENASWAWTIEPEPVYIDNPNKRNPLVVLGSEGSYDVTLTVTKDGVTYSKTIEDMVSTIPCPSVENCNNPAYLDNSIWELVYFDSEEVNYPGYAAMAFDNDPSTIWHTRWSTGSDPYPHELQIDLGDVFDISEFVYLPRQAGQNGRISEYELYISEDLEDWGEPIRTGTFPNTTAPQVLSFPQPETARYFRLRALSEVNGGPWTSIAELDVKGCYPNAVSTQQPQQAESLKAFPVPTTGILDISLPSDDHFTYTVYTLSGKTVGAGRSMAGAAFLPIDLSTLADGMYVVRLLDESGRSFYVKAVKKNN